MEGGNYRRDQHQQLNLRFCLEIVSYAYHFRVFRCFINDVLGISWSWIILLHSCCLRNSVGSNKVGFHNQFWIICEKFKKLFTVICAVCQVSQLHQNYAKEKSCVWQSVILLSEKKTSSQSVRELKTLLSNHRICIGRPDRPRKLPREDKSLLLCVNTFCCIPKNIPKAKCFQEWLSKLWCQLTTEKVVLCQNVVVRSLTMHKALLDQLLAWAWQPLPQLTSCLPHHSSPAWSKVHVPVCLDNTSLNSKLYLSASSLYELYLCLPMEEINSFNLYSLTRYHIVWFRAYCKVSPPTAI